VFKQSFGFHTAAKIEGAGSQWGTGGMETKITAARLATASGVSLAAPTAQLILLVIFIHYTSSYVIGKLPISIY
jgi:hypothetical protein